MIAKKALCLLALVVVAAAIEQEQDHERNIVNGLPATPDQFRHRASVRLSGTHICGGSILSATWIITAAKPVAPVVSTPSSLVVWTGAHYLTDGSPSTVAEVVLNPYFDSTYLFNNLALLRLSTPVAWYKYRLQPIKLPTSAITDGNRIRVIVNGWGVIPGDTSQLPVVSFFGETIPQAECSDRLGPVVGYSITSTTLCIQSLSTALSTDLSIGTGLTSDASLDVLVAVKSFGSAFNFAPEVYTAVHPYLSFILSHVTDI